MRALSIYLRERFPVALVLLMSGSFAVVCGALFDRQEVGAPRWLAVTALLAVLYFALLLRYRVTDEWKDFAHDTAAYPHRPLQRGAIGARALLLLGVIAFVLELAAATGIRGFPGLLGYLVFVALSLITAVEFFAARRLRDRFTLSFVLHELIYIPLFAWAAFVLGAGASWPTAAGVSAGAALFVSVEIVRKFQPRTDPQGRVVADTYTAVWGRPAAIVVLVVLIVSAGVLAWLAGAALASPLLSIACAAAVVFGRRSDRWVMAVGAAHLPLQAAAMLL